MSKKSSVPTTLNKYLSGCQNSNYKIEIKILLSIRVSNHWLAT